MKKIAPRVLPDAARMMGNYATFIDMLGCVIIFR